MATIDASAGSQISGDAPKAEGVRAIAPYPELSAPFGPVTTRLRRRAALVLLLTWLVGYAPFLFELAPPLKAFGLGIVLPGAGFLYAGGLAAYAMFVVTWLFCGLAFILLFGSGNYLAPIAVWTGSAALAPAFVRGPGNPWAPWFVAFTLLVLCVYTIVRTRRDFAKGRAFIDKSNSKLARIEAPSASIFGTAPVHVADELSTEDLAFQRWFIDRALQPLQSFEGFTSIDQFQFAAYRYQIAYMQYALAIAHYTRTPAFLGYSALAQRRLIEKMLQKDVWSYWALENFWGNFRIDADPIIRDNIMVSGYLLLMTGLYETVTGDQHFNTPGALTFKWNDSREFVYDNLSLGNIVAENFRRSVYGMFPCEPSLVFPICNVIAMNGLKIFDRLHGVEDMPTLLERYRHATEVEFIAPDARPVGLRIQRFGIDLKIPFPMDGREGLARLLGGDSQRVLGPGPLSPLVSAVLPQTVERELLLGNFSRFSEKLTSGAVSVSDFGRYDVGNYRNSGAGIHCWMMIAAREYGDEALFEVLRASADKTLKPVELDGVRRYEALSGLSMGQMFLGRFSRKDGLFDVVNRGVPKPWATGPVLEEVPYPDILVARAETDGTSLSLVLRPGQPSDGRVHALRLGRLRPGQAYQTNLGDTFVAGDDGRATIGVTLTDRLELDIRPGATS